MFQAFITAFEFSHVMQVHNMDRELCEYVSASPNYLNFPKTINVFQRIFFLMRKLIISAEFHFFALISFDVLIDVLMHPAGF